MSTDYQTTTVNGINTELWDHHDSAPTRRLAAQLQRGDDAIKKLRTATKYDAKILVAFGGSFAPPDGWTVAKVYNGSIGNTIISLERDDD
jgi:hypothetical protein